VILITPFSSCELNYTAWRIPQQADDFKPGQLQRLAGWRGAPASLSVSPYISKLNATLVYFGGGLWAYRYK
jgi:hypothetical protein